MRVGDEVAVGREDESGADRLLVQIAIGKAAAGDLPAAADRLVERIVFGSRGSTARALDLLGDVDADDRRRLLFIEFGEIRQVREAALRSGGGGHGRASRKDGGHHRRGSREAIAKLHWVRPPVDEIWLIRTAHHRRATELAIWRIVV